MRIGFVGNTNNYPFALALALQRKGHDITFILHRRTALDRPEKRYVDIPIPYPPWIVDLGEVRIREWLLPTARMRRCVHLLRSCDAVILNALGPTLLTRVDRPAIVFITGSDLGHYATFDSVAGEVEQINRRPRPLTRFVARAFYQRLISAQRAGIRKAVAVSAPWRGLAPRYDAILDEIGVADERRIFLQMSDLHLTAQRPPPHNAPLRIICAARLNWKRPIPYGLEEQDFKGTDIMVRGIALFYRKTGILLHIRLVKKGIHVDETRELVASEGLSEQVTWLSEMSQDEFQREVEAADIVFDSLDKGFIGVAGNDVMATGRPLIANGLPEAFEPMLGEPSPICQARTPEEVCAQLIRLQDPEERERVGGDSRSYVERHFSSDSVADVVLERLSKQSVG